MSGSNFSDYTEKQFLELLTKICASGYATEKEQIDAVFLFEELTEHPEGSDLIYYAESDEEAIPEAIILKVVTWRLANGKQGFKTED